MTFTYNLVTPNDITRVRFYIHDTDTTSYIFQDEEITFMISEGGSYQVACISCLENILTGLAQERKFVADWLQVDPTQAVLSVQAAIKDLRRKFKIYDVTLVAQNTYRPDSGMTQAPDYLDVQTGSTDDYGSSNGSWGW